MQRHTVVKFQGTFDDLEGCQIVGLPGVRKRGRGHQDQPCSCLSLSTVSSDWVRKGANYFSGPTLNKGCIPINLVLGWPSSRFYSPSSGLSDLLRDSGLR